MQWLLSLKLVVLLTVANGIPAVAWRVFGEYFNRPLDGGVAFFDRQPIFGHSKTIRGIILSLVVATASAPALRLEWVNGLCIGGVAMLGDHAVVGGGGEARPAASRIIFGVALEQLDPATGAAIGAVVVIVPIFAGERPLGAGVAQHLILFGGKLFAPFGVGEFELVHGRNVGVPRSKVKHVHAAAIGLNRDDRAVCDPRHCGSIPVPLS